MDVCICMAESLCCSPETITTLLISYIPIQNKKFKKKENETLPLGLGKVSRSWTGKRLRSFPAGGTL